MRVMHICLNRLAGCLGAALLGVAAGANAEDLPANAARLTLSGALVADDNAELHAPSYGHSTSWINEVFWEMSRSTKAQKLDFGLGAGYRWKESPGGTRSGLYRPNARFSYALERKHSRLEAKLGYSESDVSDTDIAADPVSGDPVLDFASGTRKVRQASFGVFLGEDDPVSWALMARYGGYRYDLDRASSDYYDNDTSSVQLRNALRLSPVMRLENELYWSRYQAENSARTDRITRAFSSALSRDLDQLTKLDLSLGYREVATDRVGRDVMFDGVTYGAAVTRDMALGQVGLGYDHTISANGSRDQIYVSQERRFQTGEMSLRLGVSKGDEGDPQMIAAMRYGQQLTPRNSLSASLQRAVTTASSLEDKVITRAQAKLTHDVSLMTRLDMALSYADITYPDGGGTDTTATSLIFGLSHVLPQEVVLSAGYRLRLREQESGTAHSNSLYLTVQRDFTWLQ